MIRNSGGFLKRFKKRTEKSFYTLPCLVFYMFRYFEKILILDAYFDSHGYVALLVIYFEQLGFFLFSCFFRWESINFT